MGNIKLAVNHGCHCDFSLSCSRILAFCSATLSYLNHTDLAAAGAKSQLFSLDGVLILVDPRQNIAKADQRAYTFLVTQKTEGD